MAENYFGITHAGKIRDNNEDTFIAEKVLHDRFIAGCVIDGVGGYEGGEVAALIARQSILEYFSIPSGDVTTMMREAFVLANDRINKEKENNSEKTSMACVLTMAVVDLAENKFYYAHVGDTRLYLLRDRSLVKISKDQSFVGFLEDSGRLSESEAMQHPKRNEINKALGFARQNEIINDYIEFGESPFLPGDMLLLCSDGLSDLVDSKSITSILTSGKSLPELGTELIDAANNAGGKDNITVVLIQNDKKITSRRATKPKIVKKNVSQAVVEPIEMPVEKPVQPSIQPLKDVTKKTNNSVILLTLLFLVLSGIIVWLWLQNKQKDAKLKAAYSTTVVKMRNATEATLQDTINNLTGKTLVLNNQLFQNPIVLTNKILVQKDSLYIKGGGAVFIADSSYQGPAFLFLQNCKYITLDSMTFENFDIALFAQNNKVHLKNVRFKSCRIPLQYHFIFPNDAFVTGTLKDSNLFKTDSLPK